MGVADRLYETACECRDLETKLDRVLRDLQQEHERAVSAEELLQAFKRAAGELLEAIDDAQFAFGAVLPAGVEKQAFNLKHLIS